MNDWVPVPRPMSTFYCLHLSSLTCCPPGNSIIPARFKSCDTIPVASHFSNVVPTWLPSCTIWRPVVKFGAFYTGCNRRNGPDFGRVFLMLNYTNITQNTYIQSWTVTEIMAIEMCGLLGCRRTVRRLWCHTCPTRTPARDMVMHSAYSSSDVTR